ncbi:DUF1403 family protein [Mesorhizobium microcysteis]|jgi:hypothetical protein|uniref:DUF1403 family protein n=1 Tax=Neoaquamicrobium microcysteis TaxID=2682781 RepID=A0A5D4H926_9HYPH|nr:DUF1403 family protein [Mesorhizobium microcysteis]TYR37188.1 DUF1403 family protein [Mesorhizobium microcysteis]
MILRPKTSLHYHGTLLSTPAGLPAATVPAWLRRAVPDAKSLVAHSLEDVALAAGAALGALDALIRRQERWGGAWGQRLALSAAATTAKQAGRIEDEAALRDTVLLTKTGDEVGPAGRMVLAWRRLVTRPSEDLLTRKHLGAVLEEFGHPLDDEALGDLADELRKLGAGGMVDMVVGGFAAAERYSFGRATGAWLADALVAQRLGWPRAVPLLGGEFNAAGPARPRRAGAGNAAGIEDESTRAKYLLAAQARAALRAVDLSSELGRRSERLLAVAPKLRARASDLVVERLLSDDAIVASEKIAGMSDRGLRRLFDRLVELGVVRELSGRPAFRIYGL